MSETLDVLIAFVIVIIGLSMTLQILMEALKNVFRARWNAYENAIRGLYTNHFGVQAEEQGSLWLARARTPVKTVKEKLGNPRIQSASQRMRSWAGHVALIWSTAKSMRARLVKLEEGLRAVTNPAKKVAFVREELPELQLGIERIVGLRIGDLLRIYESVRPAGAGTSPSELSARLSAQLKALQENLTESTAVQLEEGLGRLLETLREFEAEAGRIHVRVEAQLDGTLRKLEQSYTNYLKVWSFVVGAALCIAMNADAVSMFGALRSNPEQVRTIIDQQQIKGFGLESRIDELNRLTEQSEAVVADPTKASVGELKTAFDTLSKQLETDAEKLERAPGQIGAISLSGDATRAPIQAAVKALAGPDADKVELAKDHVKRGMQLIAQDYFALEASKVQSRLRYIAESDFPLGWNRARLGAAFSGFWALCVKVFGLALCSLLISFGAPLWNDILKALVGIKGALGDRAPGTTNAAG